MSKALFAKASLSAGLSVLGSLVLASFLPVGAIAAIPNASISDASSATDALADVEVDSQTVAEPSDEPSEAVETANYSDGEISIDYPATWQIAINEAGEVSIASVDPAAPASLEERIETQLFKVAAPPGPLVDANIDSFIEEGAAVSRYSSVDIDEQTALVIWLADRPSELSSAIATFIGYGDETIFLFSRYSPDNESAEESILRLHSSITKLAD